MILIYEQIFTSTDYSFNTFLQFIIFEKKPNSNLMNKLYLSLLLMVISFSFASW